MKEQKSVQSDHFGLYLLLTVTTYCFARIRANDFTGHAGLGGVDYTIFPQVFNTGSQVLLDILASFPETYQQHTI